MNFKVYKPEQAKLSRTSVLVSSLILLVWGARSMAYEFPAMAEFMKPLGKAWNVLLMDAAVSQAWEVDLLVYQGAVSPAATLGLCVALFGGGALYAFLNKPRQADMLIDMESELRKVSWPGFADAWQSTLVVTGCTLLLVFTILVYDFVIDKVLQLFVRAS